MTGAGRRNKGYRTEKQIEKMLNEGGIDCIRVPLSGATTFQKGDVLILDKYIGEVKARGNGEGFVTLENWLEGNEFLFLMRNRRTPMVCMNFEMFMELLNSHKVLNEVE